MAERKGELTVVEPLLPARPPTREEAQIAGKKLDVALAGVKVAQVLVEGAMDVARTEAETRQIEARIDLAWAEAEIARAGAPPPGPGVGDFERGLEAIGGFVRGMEGASGADKAAVAREALRSLPWRRS